MSEDMYVDYKDLDIWKISVDLIKEVYIISEMLPKNEDYNLKLQLKRAITSVALNIAEGKNRKTKKEFLNFLNISYASLNEAEAIIYICLELGYIKDIYSFIEKKNTLAKKINSLRGILNAKNI